MRSDHVLYIANIAHLLVYLCNPPPHTLLEDFIEEIRGYDNTDAQTNPPRLFQTPLPVYHYRSEFPPDNL